MKKVKGFNVGDKVFAKVKGYPAWPAIVTEANNTKYNVKFYGTGETGNVKLKDLFYYLKHKNTFVKSLKRKDYNEAIEEIESAIKESGTDGNNEDDAASDTTISPNASINESIETGNTKGGKRKRSSSVSSEKLNETQAKKKVVARSSTPANTAANSVKDSETKEDNSTQQTNQDDKVILEISNSNTTVADSPEKKVQAKLLTDVKKEDATNTSVVNESQRIVTAEDKEVDKDNERVIIKSENSDKSPVITVDDVKIVTDDHLRALVSYAVHVRKNEEIYKKKLAEKRSCSKNEIVIAKLPEGKYVGIKYNRDEPPPMKSEYEHAEYDESEAKTILSLKTVVEQGSCKPEDDPNLFVTNLDINESQLRDIVEIDLIDRKKAKLEWLRIESHLIELDAKVKGYLGLDNANPKAALELLDTMLKLDIDPLMLKKHPHVVDMIKRLRRYIGNVKEWTMNDDQRGQFEADAETVRDKAEDVYMKFAKLFDVEDETLFWDTFAKEVQEFKDQVKDFQEGQVFALSAEPNSRKAFLDGIDEEEEMKIILSKMDKPVKPVKSDKENSSHVANSDNDQDDIVIENS